MNIILVGNPNVGKSVIFNALTGSYVTVSNYPGTTVDISNGPARIGHAAFTVIDTPGVNSLTVHSEDEQVTKNILDKGDIACVVQVADAKNLKRSLLLTFELIERKVPMVLVLNMSDEARERGMITDCVQLSLELGIDVVETVATTGEGIAKLKDAILKARVPRVDIVPVQPSAGKADAVWLLEERNRVINDLIARVSTQSKSLGKRVSAVIGNMALRPITGIPMLILVLVFMYFFVGRLAAGTGVDFLQNTVFAQYVNPAVTGFVDRFIPINFLREMLVGEYGVITMAVTYALAIIFPIVTAFFLFFGFLEDSGYLPRLTVLSDRVFKTMGLNGRAILPMILGLGCGTMATLTTRILETKKERILATLLLALAVPCSAQLGVVMGLLGSISIKALFVWLTVMLSVMIFVGWCASRVIPGERCPFIQEIPPIRLPQVKNILVKTLARLKWYLKEAVPLFIVGTLILFFCDKIGILQWIEDSLSPVTVHILGLPREITKIFILGFLRRDYGAAGLYDLSKTGVLDSIQLLVTLVVITLFIPCVAQFFVTVKERGIKAGCVIAGFTFVFAVLVGYFLNISLRWLIIGLGIPVL